MSQINYWVYILICANGNYYTGYTNNLKKRYQEHILGTAKCRYTRSFKPLGIAQCWRIQGNKSTAMKIEILIKKLTKRQKEYLILYPESLQLYGISPLTAKSLASDRP